MKNIKLLDCTLRDGGYVNDFKFGKSVIKSIIVKLAKASIDVIECGFLKKDAFDEDCSLFGSVEQITQIIDEKNPRIMYVAMLQFGKIGIEDISDYDGLSIDGIRLTFHEHEINEAIVLGQQLMDKGYKVFMQPVGTMTYSDRNLMSLIEKINDLKPYAFYIVDTLGTMYKSDLLRMFYLVDNNLNKEILLGFHSHNNLQLSFANAQELIQMRSGRTIIIDSSVYGMGRGAGNLNTELLTQYINFKFEFKYDNIEILEIVDKYIKPLSVIYKWGYDIAYYIASISGCHPNYASYLIEKQTLSAKDIYAVLSSMEKNKRNLFDKEYIKNKYIEYLNHSIDDRDTIIKLSRTLSSKKILLLAPGKSLEVNIDTLKKLILENDYYVISVNFIPGNIPINCAFISNIKRFNGLKELFEYENDLILTSNITVNGSNKTNVINFFDYLNEEELIMDNAGLMCLNLMKKLNIKDILLAGFDGFSMDLNENYVDKFMIYDIDRDKMIEKNNAFRRKIAQLSLHMNINFLGGSIYKTGGNNIE